MVSEIGGVIYHSGLNPSDSLAPVNSVVTHNLSKNFQSSISLIYREWIFFLNRVAIRSENLKKYLVLKELGFGG